ncbi:hypothetical protein Poly21_01520 [Allorhodopirellula heiligendammensis]|uniref:Uncharacterized protein n=1 Tax=Allorhodopirellula heiligendammensis TaxID=2714739 RepID=A0A5C6C5C1_9BACT|nr:hypothetical protein Poly21_01520 [Allorhodopirellula heiligendammensis]
MDRVNAFACAALVLVASVTPTLVASRANKRTDQNTEAIHRLQGELNQHYVKIRALETRLFGRNTK